MVALQALYREMVEGLEVEVNMWEFAMSMVPVVLAY
jgi:hypothetical protein